MKPCGDYEVEIEMRLHGALEAARAAELDAHLATCAACRAFEALARDTEARLATQAAVEVRAVDWEALRVRLRASVTREFNQGWRSLLLFFLVEVSAILLIGEGHFPDSELVLVLVGILAVVMLARRVSERRQLRRVERWPQGFLKHYRARLERNVKYAPTILQMVVLGALSLWLTLKDAHSWTERGGAVLYALGFVGLSAHARWVHVPRLKRELDELRE